MQTPESYVNERLNHLGVVAAVCEEIGLATYLDRLAGETKHQVSMGTTTVAMILNGLGSVIDACTWCHSSLPTNWWSICSVQE